jgi:hypothetical protein
VPSPPGAPTRLTFSWYRRYTGLAGSTVQLTVTLAPEVSSFSGKDVHESRQGPGFTALVNLLLGAAQLPSDCERKDRRQIGELAPLPGTHRHLPA